MTLHLSDHDLQLAAGGAPLPAAQAAHLQACGRCQAQQATYQQLFAAAAHLPPPAFEFDLAAAVLAQLPRPKPAFPWVLVLVAVPVVGVVIAFLALFGSVLRQAFQGLATLLGAGLVAVVALVVAGQCLEWLARHRRQMRLLSFS